MMILCLASGLFEICNTTQYRLQLVHVPGTISSHSENSLYIYTHIYIMNIYIYIIYISGPKNYNAITVNVRCNEQYDSLKHKSIK